MYPYTVLSTQIWHCPKFDAVQAGHRNFKILCNVMCTPGGPSDVARGRANYLTVPNLAMAMRSTPRPGAQMAFAVCAWLAVVHASASLQLVGEPALAAPPGALELVKKNEF